MSTEIWQRKSDAKLVEAEQAPIARAADGVRLFRVRTPGRIMWSYYHPDVFPHYFVRAKEGDSCEVSLNPASIPRDEEDGCPETDHGRSSLAASALARQRFANQSARHYQRLGIPFADLLALFRLAGKAYDRGVR